MFIQHSLYYGRRYFRMSLSLVYYCQKMSWTQWNSSVVVSISCFFFFNDRSFSLHQNNCHWFFEIRSWSPHPLLIWHKSHLPVIQLAYLKGWQTWVVPLPICSHSSLLKEFDICHFWSGFTFLVWIFFFMITNGRLSQFYILPFLLL